MKYFLRWVIFCFVVIRQVNSLNASEVIQETQTKVIVREHPKTGRPYVSITPLGAEFRDPFERQRTNLRRPDYRMLDPKVKDGEIPYDGPYQDSKKVYIFAATLATLGTAGGVIGLTMIPASAGGAASGAGAYLASGGAIAGGTTAALLGTTKSNPEQDDVIQTSKSHLVMELENQEEKTTTS